MPPTATPLPRLTPQPLLPCTTPQPLLPCTTGLVSYLPVAAPEVWHIAEGNAALSARLLQASGAALLRGYRVTAITRLPAGRYQLQCQQQLPGSSSTAQAQQEVQVQVQEYDAVIIAAPLELANISFSGLQLPPLPARKYQATVTTYLQGVLDPAYFSLPGPDMPAGDILASNDASMPWTSVADKGQMECSVHGQVQQAGGSAAGSAGSAGSRQQGHAQDAASAAPAGSAEQGEEQRAGEEVQASRRLQAAQQQQEQQQQQAQQGQAALCSSAGGPQARLYKMFSAAPLQQEELARLFKSHKVSWSQLSWVELHCCHVS
jgi:hypothetical protein